MKQKSYINYVTFEQEKIDNNLNILQGCLDGLLNDIEICYEKKFRLKGDKSSLEVLSYLKYKLNKPIESFYYGYESFLLDRNSVGIVYAALSLIKINNHKAKEFIYKHRYDIIRNIGCKKFNRDNVSLKDKYKLINIVLS